MSSVFTVYYSSLNCMSIFIAGIIESISALIDAEGPFNIIRFSKDEYTPKLWHTMEFILIFSFYTAKYVENNYFSFLSLATVVLLTQAK